MAWEIGLNFRSTAGYVTDGADETYVIEGDAYPVTRAGVTFGWNSEPPDYARDRTTGNDSRLAGVHFFGNGGSDHKTFRIDVPAAGDYDVRLAVGDGGSSQAYQHVQLIDSDGTTVLYTLADTDGTASNNFDDAQGANHTAAAWPGGNTLRTITLTGTALYVKVGAITAQSESSSIAHLQVVQVDAAGDGSARIFSGIGSGTFTYT